MNLPCNKKQRIKQKLNFPVMLLLVLSVMFYACGGSNDDIGISGVGNDNSDVVNNSDGVDNGGGNVSHTDFGWTDAGQQHIDYVDQNNISECTKCHNIDDRNAPFLSCYTCHDNLWDKDDGSSGTTAVMIPVAAGSDDAEEHASGAMSLNSSDLELTYDGDGNQKVGMRFTLAGLPQGALIRSAYIQIKVDETSSEQTSLMIHGEASDHAAWFTETPGNISSRMLTSAFVPWEPLSWDTAEETGVAQRTPDLSSVIQEIVDRPGWEIGNALAIIITGTGKRVGESYEGDQSGTPVLIVECDGCTGDFLPTRHQSFNWTNAGSDHRSYVKSNGIEECLSCHNTTDSNDDPMSCLVCHGNNWDGDGGTGENPGHHGWSNPRSSHKSWKNFDECLSCHNMDSSDKANPLSCYHCHGNKW